MAVKLAYNRVEQFCDGSGLPYSGAKLFTYVAGSSAKLPTYTENTGSVANTNPIVLDSSGRLPQPVWLTVGSTYKFVLAPSTDTDPPTSPIWTLDNISGINDASLTIDQWVSSGLTPTFVSATSFTLAGDQTTAFHVGRRLKTTNTAGTVYSTISTSVFGALTTVTVVNDSTTLDVGLSAVSYGLITNVNHSLPSLQAKGDILTQATPGTVARLAAGIDYFGLISSSSATNGIQWVNNYSANVSMVNGALTTSRTGNAETIALKTLAGNDPSVTDPVIFTFRATAIAPATYSRIAVTAALSITISSGSTLGASNAVPFRVWVVVFNDTSTIRLGVVNCLSGTNVIALRDDIRASSTAEGGSGGATSAQVIYTDSAVSTKAMRILGYFEYTLATAGTWNTAPTKGHIFSPGTPTPGQVVQTVMNQTGAVATGTTVIPADDTIPQITEGDQYMTQAITPTSAANLLEIESVIARLCTNSGGTNNMAQALFQDATANALAATGLQASATASDVCVPPIKHKMVAGTASSTTFRIRAGGSVAGTTTFNGGSAGTRVYGGVLASSMYVREIMT